MKVVLQLSKRAVDALLKSGEYSSSKNSSTFYKDGDAQFIRGYDWIVSQMTAHGLSNKSGDDALPVWAWPADSDQARYAPNDFNGCIIVAEVDPKECLFTDFDGYHSILNNCPYIEPDEVNDTDDEEYDRLFDQLSKSKEKKIESWNKIIINPNFDDEYWEDEILNCQITFWKLRLSDVVEVYSFNHVYSKGEK